MGRRITIDSATMLNKGLEIIEACRLFDLPPSTVKVTVHPQSTVHSLVEYVDGSIAGADLGDGYAAADPVRAELSGAGRIGPDAST